MTPRLTVWTSNAQEPRGKRQGFLHVLVREGVRQSDVVTAQNAGTCAYEKPLRLGPGTEADRRVLS